jgi:hypothetical protein
MDCLAPIWMKDRLDAQGPFPAVVEEVAEPIALDPMFAE